MLLLLLIVSLFITFQLISTKCPDFIGYNDLKQYESIYGETATSGIRVNLTNAMINERVMCLDGSVGVFYVRKGHGDGLNKFHVFLEGGGACAGIQQQVISSFDTCVHRAGTSLGSSKSYPNVSNFDNAYLSTNQETNPLTFNWNTVYVKYCDGSCYSSNNKTVLKINATLSLHFTGFGIIEAVFDALMDNYGYSNASDLLLSGCSAGGAGTFLHSDYIYHNKLPAPTKMGAMPDSGFFLEYEGKGQLMTAVKWQYDNMNTTASLNQDCIAAQPKGDEYLCMFAQETAPYSFVNTFALQSQYDLWQTEQELMSDNVTDINVYGKNLSKTIFADYATGSKHHIFLDSCAHHCGEWDEIEIDGYLARRAQYEWYHQYAIHDPVYYQNKTYPCDACCKNQSNIIQNLEYECTF